MSLTILITISFQANNNPSRIILHFLYYNSTCTCFCFFIYTNGIIKTLITSLEHFICYFRSQYAQGTMRNVHKSRLYHQKDSCLFSQNLFYLSFALFSSVIFLSVLRRRTVSDYTFGIFKLCLGLNWKSLRVVISLKAQFFNQN
jgi:uncharacterized membrane protein